MSIPTRVLVRFCTTAMLALLVVARPSPAAAGQLDEQISTAFAAAYNLDHETALTTARAAIAAAPDESRAHRALAGILWLQALFHRGAVTVDHYSGGVTRPTMALPKPPRAIEEEFRKAITRAIELAEARLQKMPENIDALYDAGAAYGLQASWTASVEGRVRAAFGTARRAFSTQEKVLALDPKRVGAGTVVGTYRYAVSRLGFASRMVAYLAGLGGGKEEGIALLEAATVPRSESRFEARTALVLIYSLEGRHEDAFELLTRMSTEFPDNRILVLERGGAAIRAGRAGDADAILSSGIATLDADTRRKLPGERALWFHRRGLARLSLKRLTDASADFHSALESHPEPWMQGRTELALGKLADLAGRRPDALARYRRAREIARSANDRITQDEAAILLRRPFTVSVLGDATPGQTVQTPGAWHSVPGFFV